MDSIRVSEAPDPGSIPGEATQTFKPLIISGFFVFAILHHFYNLLTFRINWFDYDKVFDNSHINLYYVTFAIVYKVIVIFIMIFMALGVTQPNGYIQSFNFQKQYEQCCHEDHDITLLDFIFEHLLNLEAIVNLLEGEHEYVGDDSPHIPFQQLEASQVIFATTNNARIEIKERCSFVESRVAYATYQNDKLPSNFCADIFRPPISI